MKRIWVIALAVAAGAIGCATSGEIEHGAYQHQENARRYQAQGDYHAAAREQRAADEQHAKAQRRAYDEAYNRAYWY